ncbi:hypothetical protein BBJ28_00007562 [Nothophytophthora sp. Chile5]|nr:hypothetical protein BBJ28_00007562 [Nothophytophthora sp. Chile5]
MISPEVMQELLSVRQVLNFLPTSPSTEKGWTRHESQLFWVALIKYPQGPWTAIAEFIGSKSTRQAMTHGQKLRQKLKRWNKRLRRNPAVSSLLDGVTVTPDGNVAIGASQLSCHAVYTQPAALSVAQSLFACIPGDSATMKQEELRNSVPIVPEREISGAFYDQVEANFSGIVSVMNTRSARMTASVDVPEQALPTLARLDQYATDAAVPQLYSTFCDSRMHLPDAGNCATDTNQAMVCTMPGSGEVAFDGFARVAWSEPSKRSFTA